MGGASLLAGVLSLFGMGIVLGLLTTFLVPVRSGVASLGVVLALLGCLGVGRFGRWVTAEPLAALVPAGGWLVIALLGSTFGPGGDLVLAKPEPGLLFLLAGSLGGVAAVLPWERGRSA